MKAARFDSTLFKFCWLSFALGLFLWGSSCTREPTDITLPLGRPVIDALGVPPHGPFSRVEISARPPGTPAWSARLEKDVKGAWRIVSRSDRSGEPADLADSKLVDHFLEIVGTFATEAAAGNGNDAVFGLNPYRMEIRLGDSPTKALQLGDLAGPTGIYFRIGPSGSVWTGRGALIAFLPTLETPEVLVDKSPFYASLDEVVSVRLEKLQAPDRGVWEFVRVDSRWLQGKTPLREEKAAILERIFRQRLLRLLPPTERPDLSQPDWKLSVRTGSSDETMTLAYALNDVFGANPARSERPFALYPELAGALRAFTHARFTPRKSGTK